MPSSEASVGATSAGWMRRLIIWLGMLLPAQRTARRDRRRSPNNPRQSALSAAIRGPSLAESDSHSEPTTLRTSEVPG